MPWETAVVDGRFYSPHPTFFRVTPNHHHGFTVTSIAGTSAPAMQVESAYSSTDRRTLRFVDAASRRVVLTVQESPFSSRRTWVAFWGRSTWRRDRLFAAREKVSFLNDTTIDIAHVFLASNRREQDPDFTVHWSSRRGAETMTISRGYNPGAVITLIDRERIGLGGDMYTLTINPYVDHAFILALTVMLHEMDHYRSPQRSR
ncbi:unnamed protein product [Alopecurus aequalis]